MRNVSNPAEFGRVAVLMGGHSAEREISLISGTAVLNALQQQGIDAYSIDVGDDVYEQLQGGQFDRVFIVLHGRGGEDGQIQGLLQTMKLPYTGSGINGAVLSMNKRLSKLVWKAAGLPTAGFWPVNAATDTTALIDELALPLIIKPVNEGSSIGMSKVTDADELKAGIAEALRFDKDVIAEQWIEGEEYTVAVLDGHALPVIRLSTPNAFYDFDAKYKANTTQYLCPCGLTTEQEQHCQQLAEQAFQALQMRGWGRIDFMRDKQGNFYLLEANSVPGMTDHSLVPMAAKAQGLSFEQLVWKVLETSFAEADR
jgi:D-alanine-D-alanine ligase